MNIKCFYIIPTGFTYRFLRRYQSSDEKCNTSETGYHDARVFIDGGIIGEASSDCDLDKTDPRWPTHCACGYKFTEKDEWQLFIESEYQRTDNGEKMTLNTAPVGAIWRADWYEDAAEFTGIDGKSYVVKTPGGLWAIDSRASNCTLPNDTVHKCWCRHGEPPNFTVDKNGNTCGAGAGSILQRNYHGFLRNGELVEC